MTIPQGVVFNEQGLVPVVTQDEATGRVLMLAYMNREALEATLTTGRAVYYSRSRAELWRKGDTSGHAQFVRRVELDCDGDALLITVQIVVVVMGASLGSVASVDANYGSPAAIGEALVTDYLLAFEVVSVILFMAAVAGVVFGTGGRPVRLSEDQVLAKESESAVERRREASRAALDAARDSTTGESAR